MRNLRYLVLFVALLEAFMVKAQSTPKLQLSTTVPSGLNVCGSSQDFTLSLHNTQSSNMTDLVVTVVMTEGVVLDATGSYGDAVLLGYQSGNISRPQFTISQLNAGATAQINYAARAKCDVVTVIRQLYPNLGSGTATVKNYTSADYKISSTVYTDSETNGSGSYNILISDISIGIDEQYKSIEVNVGDDVERKIKILNKGTGFLTKLRFTVKYPSTALIEQKSIKLGGVALTQVATGSPYTITYEITDFSAAVNSLGSNGDPAKFEPDERFEIVEKVWVKQCAAENFTDFNAQWGCDAAVCNYTEVPNAGNGAFGSFLSTGPAAWSMEETRTLIASTDLCGTSVGETEYAFKNAGLAAIPGRNRANNVRIWFRKYGNFRPVTIAAPLSECKMYVTNSSNPSTGSFVALSTFFSSMIQYSADYWGVDLDNNPAVFNTDIDGPGGLEDLDKDGYYDDLPEGASLKFRMLTNILCANNTCSDPGISHAYDAVHIDFTDGCGNNRLHSGGQYSDYLSLFDNGSLVEGPEEIAHGEVKSFKFTANLVKQYNSGLMQGFLTCSDLETNYTSTVNLPVGYSLVSGTLKWNGVVLTSGQYSQSGQLLTINLGGQGNYTMDLQFNCGAYDVPENSNVEWKMYYRCSSSCTSCDYLLLCKGLELYNYCIGYGVCNSYITDLFKVERASFGTIEINGFNVLDYNQWLASPKVNASTPGILLNRVMSYDTIAVEVKGVLSSSATAYTNTHVRIQYISPIFDPATNVFSNLFDYLSGDIYVNNVKCATVLPAPTVSVLPNNSGSRLIVLDFKFTSSVCSISPGDQVDFYLKLRVKKLTPLYGYGDLFALSRFRASLQTSTVGEAVGCNSKGNKLDFYLPFYQQQNWYADLYCTGIIKSGVLRFEIGPYDRFQNEFRPLTSIRKVSFPLDNKLTYESGSSQFIFNHNCCGLGVTKATINPVTTSTHHVWDFSQAGNYSGRYVAEPSMINAIVQANFTRSCENKEYVPENYYYDLEYDQYIYTRNPSFIETASGSALNLVQDYSKANMVVTPEALQEGYRSSVQWKITIQNPATVEKRASADRTWLALVPVSPGITITNAVYDGSTVTVRHYGTNSAILELGNVALNSSHELIVHATYKNCIENYIDTINVIAGYTCHNKNYPLTPAQSDCMNETVSSKLFIRYKNANLVPKFTRVNPAGAVNVCTPITYQVELNSTGYGDLSNVVVEAKLPEGFSYVPFSATYTYEGITGALDLTSVSGDGHTVTWNLSIMKPLFNTDILNTTTGVGTGIFPGFRLEGKDVLFVNFQLEAQCGIDAGESVVRISASAITNCGDNRLTVHDDKLLIEGMNPLDKMRVSVSCNTFDDQSKLANITAAATNTGLTPLGQDLPNVLRYMTITLPQGIIYEPSSSSQGEPAKTTALSNGSTVYWWLLPALGTTAPGNNFPLSFKIRRQNFDVTVYGNQVVVTAATMMIAEDVYCASQNNTCELRATTAKSSCSIRLQTNQCSSCNGSFSPEADKKYVLSGWVKEGSSFTTAVNSTYQKAGIQLYFAGAEVTMGPFYGKGAIIDSWQRIEEIITIPSNITKVEIRLINHNTGSPTVTTNVYFDDLRIHPFNSNMKSFVYDPYTLRLSAELDENNYATFYEYDQEGGLIRVKKETEKGVMTIQESRSNNVKQ